MPGPATATEIGEWSLAGDERWPGGAER